MNTWNLLILMQLAGLAGMLSHFWKKLAQNQTADGLKAYVMGHPAYTLRALAVTAAAVSGLWEVTDVTALTGVTAYITVVTGAYTAGWTFDSLLNKASDAG